MLKYNTVIEIGTNVGVFTVFFASWLAKRTKGKVFAFEPSRTAYERLLKNVAANAITNAVAFNCAVGSQTGFFPFFAPEQHLTNGSLDAEFARQFTSILKSEPVLVVDACLIQQLFEPDVPVLLKIDAEGAETNVLRSLEHFIRIRRPDIVLEVLPQYEANLNELSFLCSAGYRFFSIRPTGLSRTTGFAAGTSRDYFLTAAA